nr:hypothetical protein CFP56_56731 [Quercus suber]
MVKDACISEVLWILEEGNKETRIHEIPVTHLHTEGLWSSKLAPNSKLSSLPFISSSISHSLRFYCNLSTSRVL